MKKLFFAGLTALLFFLVLGNVSVFAYTLDGSLNDWGVTPFVNWAPVSSTAHYVERNDVRFSGENVWGGEPYDIEALYFDNDAENLYFAMVSSYPQNGVLAGDLGIDLNQDAQYEYGVNLTHLSPNSNIQQVALKQDPQWFTAYGYPTVMFGGSTAGMSDVFYKDAGILEGPNSHTYILEGRISRLLFNPLAADGSQITLSYALVCLNDYMLLKGDIDHTHQPIPEPGTFLLFTTGILGFGGFGFRRFKKA